MARVPALLTALALAFGAPMCVGPAHRAPPPPRPEAWAQPHVLPGCPNLHIVDARLWRGAQPTAEGFRALHAAGIRTVLNLRHNHDDRDEARGVALDLLEIPVTTYDTHAWQVEKFLAVACDPARQPVFVHCQHGADRTGMMCAFWRVAVQGWPKEAAIREMVEGNMGHHELWTNLLARIRETDIVALRRKVGLPDPEPAPTR